MVLGQDSGKEGFCLEHARLVTLVRRQASHRSRHRDTPDTLVQSLSQYGQFSVAHPRLPDPEGGVHKEHKTGVRPAIDYYSESSDEDSILESVQEGTPIFTETADAEIDDSDEPLKHAGVFTTEEIATLARDKLIKLQSLYTEYFKILALKLKTKRQKYRALAQAELRQHGTGFATFGSPYKDEKKLKQLRAMRRYRRHFGPAALLREKAQNLRKEASGKKAQKSSDFIQCFHKEAETQCSLPALPSTKFCIQHIMNDDNQFLFSRCEAEGCGAPTIPVGTSSSRCWVHQPISNTDSAFRPSASPIQSVNPAYKGGTAAEFKPADLIDLVSDDSNSPKIKN